VLVHHDVRRIEQPRFRQMGDRASPAIRGEDWLLCGHPTMQVNQPGKRLAAGEIGEGRLLIVPDALSCSFNLRVVRCVLR